MQLNSQELTIYDFLKYVERELIKLIDKELREMHITSSDAISMAQDFLDMLPIYTWGQMCKKLSDFSKKHIACRKLYVQYASSYDELVSEKKAQNLSKLLYEENIEKAYYLMRGGIL